MIDTNRVTNEQFEALRAYQNAAIVYATCADLMTELEHTEERTAELLRAQDAFKTARAEWLAIR